MTQDPPGPAVGKDLLPPGPGLLSRWLVAVPLMVLTTTLPMAGQLVLGAWTSLSFHDTFSDLDDSSPMPTFWSALHEEFASSHGGVFVVPGVVLLVFLLRRTRFAAWPKACLWLAVWAVGPSALLGSAFDSGDSFLPNLALGVGLSGSPTSWDASHCGC